MTLEKYQRKRKFAQTPEPRGAVKKTRGHRFVVQEHHASHLHFDFRLEIGGVLKSWAVPKGPSLDPAVKRLAVEVEDHPVDYIDFEGHIAEGNYGAGEVAVWDSGTYVPLDGDPLRAWEDGRLKFELKGKRLKGEFNLVRLNRPKQWLLMKSRDEFARRDWTAPVLMDEGGPQPAAGPRPRGKPARRTTRPRAGSSETLTAEEFIALRKPAGDVDVKVDGEVVTLTHLDKPFWPDEPISKGELLQYYARMGPYILPHLKDRPLILVRYPNGIGQRPFFQHELAKAPPFVRTERLKAEQGRMIDYAIAGNLASLLYVANLGTITQNPWLSRTGSIDCPDWIVFDLDPEAVGFDVVCEVALAIRDVLAELGLECYAKTSGSRGMHVYVPVKPVYGYEQAADFAELVALVVTERNPECATLQRSLRTREAGHVYIDHLQNAKGKSVASVYSARAKPGAPVSTPLDWDEVKRKPDLAAFNLHSVPRRVEKQGDLFKPVLGKRQTLTQAVKRLEKIVKNGQD